MNIFRSWNQNSFARVAISSAVLALLMSGLNTQAASKYWDTSAGLNNGVGGSGTWGTTFSTTSTGDAMLTNSATNDDDIFQGTAGTVTLSGNQTANSLTFNTTGYAITTSGSSTRTLAGSITLSDNVSLTLAPISGATLEVSSISGGTSSGLTIGGSTSLATDAIRINLLSKALVASSAPITILTTGSSGIAGFVSAASTATNNASIINNSSVATMLGATSGNTLKIGGIISGSAGVQFSAGASGGSGTIVLNAANTYSGSTVFNALTNGTITLGIDNAISTASAVTMASSSANGGILDLNGHNQTIASLTSGAGGGYITNSGTSSTLSINGSVSPAAFGLVIADDGTHKVALTRGGTGSTILSGANTFTGGVNINGGILNVNGTETASTSGPLGKSGTISFGGGTLQYSSADTADYSSRFNTAANQAYSIDTAGQTVNFATALNSSGGSLTKLGTGTLNLNVANTYSGNTTISAGTLKLGASGSINNSPNIIVNGTFDVSAVSGFTIGASQTLKGSGTVSGAVTVNGTLSPGNSSIGALTLATAPTFSGTNYMEITNTASPNADEIVLTNGTLTYGGTLIVTNIGGALANGNSFNLFTNTANPTGFSGWFSTVTLPALASGLAWDTNKLATNGVLDIYSFAFTGGTLTMSTSSNAPAQLLIAKVLAYVSSARGIPTLASVNGASHGTLNTNVSAITYTPTLNYLGNDSFNCVVTDGHGTLIVPVNVTVVNPQNPTLTGNGSNLAIRSDGSGGMTIIIAGTAGTNYLLQYTSDFAGWTNYAPAFAMPSTGITNFDDTSGVTPRFYRTVLP